MEAATLAIHITSFSLSLILFPVLAIAATVRYRLPGIITKTSLALTGVGLMTGIGLLIVHPTGSRCLMLAAYLVAFIALYSAAISVPSSTLSKERVRK